MKLRRAITASLTALALCLAALPGRAEGPVRLFAPEALVETGLFAYLLPRFSLKTQVKVTLTEDPADAQIVLGDAGRAMFNGAGTTWHMALPGAGDAGADRLAAWLGSEVGQRTILSYAPDGAPLFAPPETPEAEAVAVVIDGDAALGLDVSRRACARCHAVEAEGLKKTIGSTPSFFVLRAFEDWEERFGAFYVLNPHPAFTRIAEVTPPFPIDRPSPISPVDMTIEELEAVMAYVARLDPADLGAPLQAQEF